MSALNERPIQSDHGRDREAAPNLEALNDPRQLQAMLLGKDDTISELRKVMSALDASLKERDNAVTSLSARSRRLASLLKEARRVANHALGEAQTLKTELANIKDAASQIETILIKNEGHFDTGAKIAELLTGLIAAKNVAADLDRSLEEQDIVTGNAGREIAGMEAELVGRSTSIAGLASLLRKERNDAAVARRQLEALRGRHNEHKLGLPGGLHSHQRLEVLSPNYKSYFDSRNEIDADAAGIVHSCEAMRAELRNGLPIYQPSQFWEQFYNYNLRALTEAGLANFKLTVNQNYQNFIPRSLFDRKVRFLLRWFRKNPSLHPLFAMIFNPDGVAEHGYLAQPGTEIFNDDLRQLATYRLLVTLGWEFIRGQDGLQIADRLIEPELGNPIRVLHRGKLISQDLATSVAEINDFISPLRARIGNASFSVLEVGGGYGRLAHALMSTMPVKRYVIVDIPPALHVSTWYLRKLFPEKKIFEFRPFQNWEQVRDEAEQADVLFLLASQIDFVPDGFVDISIAVSSLHEMRLEQANNFLRHMGRVSRELVGSKQYWVYPNPYDGIVLKHEEYEIPAGYKSVYLADDRLNSTFFVDVLGKGS